jgi:tetratricopeptide (TPR) repeat protein
MKYRKIVLIVFIVLVGVSLIYALMDQRTVTTSSEKAYQAYLRGEDLTYRFYQQEALQEYEIAAKLDPNFAMAYARMAWLYKIFDRQKEYLDAKTRAVALLDRVKDKERIIINLGFARAEERSSDIDHYTKELVDKFPDSFDAHEVLSTQYLSDQNYDKVIEENQILLKKKPNYIQSYNLLGYAYFYKGEYDKALENIEKYSDMAPDQANPHDSHGELLLNMGRYDEALAQFRTADSIKAGLYFVVCHLGDTYAAKGMYRDAIGAYLKARDLSPNDKMKVLMDANVAMCYVYCKQPDMAIGILQEALARVPDDLKSNAILGGIYSRSGRMDDALVQLGIVKGVVARFKIPPNTTDKNLLATLGAEKYLSGAIAMDKGEYSLAATNFNYVCQNAMISDKVLFSSFLGDALLKAGMTDSAITVLSNALKYNPNSSLCLRFLAASYGKAGQKAAQREILSRYLSVMKDADDGNPNVDEASAQLEELNRKNL